MNRVLLVAAFALVAGSAQAESNVALGAQVGFQGSGLGVPGSRGCPACLAPFQTVTDGAFLEDGHPQNSGTLFWAGPYGSAGVIVYTGVFHDVSSITLQAAGDTRYLINWLSGSTWSKLAVVRPEGDGMQTVSFSFSSVRANGFEISVIGGDPRAAVSEFQAFGAAVPTADLISSPVPEPTSTALLLAGLLALGTQAGRSRRQ